jgi:hypothetical protein
VNLLGLTVSASVQGENYALDNRFHRTDLRFSGVARDAQS